MNWQLLGFMIIAYLIGCISSAILISKVFSLPDPREFGSKNPGATNVYRLSGKYPAVAVLIFDVLKGMVPVWVGYKIGFLPFGLGLIALSACVGHIFPIFFKFRGGKGVATAFGAIAPIGFGLSLATIFSWLVVFFISRYSSLSSIITALLLPFYVWLIKPQFTLPVALVCCLLVFRHQDNIFRIYAGKEDRFKLKREK